MEEIPGLEVVPLNWSITVMLRAFERVRGTGWDDPMGAFAAIGETLWWIGVVREGLDELYPGATSALAAREPQRIDELLAGLRFARNRIGHGVDEVRYATATALGPSGTQAKWTWEPLERRPKGSNNGYEAYQLSVAGVDVVESLVRATIFLGQVASQMWRQPDVLDSSPH